MSFTRSQEAALVRTLRDIADGHLTLWISVAEWDAQADEPKPGHWLSCVRPDRGPAAGTPNAASVWWAPLIERDWIKPRAGDGRPRYCVSDLGRVRLASA